MNVNTVLILGFFLLWVLRRWWSAGFVVRSLKMQAEIQRTLDQFVKATGAVRATVLDAHESPRVGEQLVTTAKWESVEPGFFSLCTSWRDVPLQRDTRAVLLAVLSKGELEIRRENMGPGQLRDEYGAQGIVHGWSVSIITRPSLVGSFFRGPKSAQFLWICADWDATVEVTDEHRAELGRVAHKLRKLVY